MTLRDIERVLYFEAYVVTDAGMVNDDKIKRAKLLSEETISRNRGARR